MTILGVIAGSLLVVLTVAHGLAVAAFWIRLGQPRIVVDQKWHPPAAVILPLRGRDPFLAQSLAALLDQDYPDYQVQVVLDSDEDAAWQDLRPLLERMPPHRFSVQLLEKPSDECSLKVSALLQALERLDVRFEAIALMDSDVMPHACWLSDLVAPLADPRVGASTGQRWYGASVTEWGTSARFAWNVGAVVQIWLYGIVWAGSLAMRRLTITEIGLCEAWRHALSDDGVATRELRRHDKRVSFVPEVLMFNRERISISNFYRWVQRQLIAARPSGPAWRIAWLHCLNLLATHVLTAIMLAVSLATGSWMALAFLATLWAVYWSSCILWVMLLDRRVRQRLTASGRDLPAVPAGVAWRLIPAIVLAHVMYPAAALAAGFRRRLSWRGIEYEVLGQDRVRRLNYVPFRAAPEPSRPESVL
jgi:cellulose synthase/poly-beta-1,6-N-acetylglucosamine synthase-like glycosyltransferase